MAGHPMSLGLLVAYGTLPVRVHRLLDGDCALWIQLL